MKKQESKYESYEETEKKCIVLAGYMMGRGMLKYASDPVGMLLDEDYKIFVSPFLKYLNGDMSWDEAQDELNGLRTDVMAGWISNLHSLVVEIFYEKKTGRDFWADYNVLKEGDEKDKKDAAINLVSVLKPMRKENSDVKALLEKAVIEGDESFYEAIYETTDHRDKKLWLNYLIFARHNEEAISKMSQDEVVALARVQGILSRVAPENVLKAKKEKESFLRYLQRLGGKKESIGRPRKLVKDNGTDDEARLLRLKLKNHEIEFSFYLFGPDTKEEIEKHVNSIKKLVLNFR